MSIWGAFTNSTQAMMTHSHAMNVIGQNIANVNTNGYKRAEDNFATVLSETTAQFDFFGVKPVTRKLIDFQGSMQPSSSGNDLAVNGQGFFIVNSEIDGSGSYYYTRAGNFQGRSYDTGEPMLDASGNAVTDADGNARNQEAAYLSTPDGYYLMGWVADTTTGDITTTTTLTGMSAIRTDLFNQISGVATSELTLRANIDARTLAGESEVINVPIWLKRTNGTTNAVDYVSQSVTTTWTRNGTANSWDVTFAVDASLGSVTTPAAATTVTFQSNGTLATTSANTVDIGITWLSQTNSGVTYTFDNSSFSFDYSHATQLAGSTLVNNVTQDGLDDGVLIGTNFSSEGYLVGTYSNGSTKRMAQVPLATVPAPNGMDMLSNNLFLPTELSGDISILNLASNSRSSLVAGALELSNVDLADEFTRMIVTQKAYSSAATVFKTADEMTQGARDLKR